ncbi:MAG: FecR domain-containing protein [Flavobacteriales bacterium]|nr:FecR domain-containing protein [Flavobacteriales bacterium]
MKTNEFDNFFKEKVADSETVHEQIAQDKKERIWSSIASKNQASKSSTLLKYAASIALLIGLGFLYQSTFTSNEVTIASLQEIKEITLPDNSKIWLNKNSEVSYSPDFETRNIDLKGEAFFEIEKDASRPFTIYTAETKTTVLGTSFNINSDAESVEITVVTGKVLFEHVNKTNAGKVELVKGDLATVDAVSHKILQSLNEDMNFLAWKNKKIIFDNTPLVVIEKTLEAYFNVEIEIAEPAIYEKRGTGTFVDPTLENMLMVLTHGLNLNYKKTNHKYIITSNDI